LIHFFPWKREASIYKSISLHVGIFHFETHFSKDWALEAILQIDYEISGRFLCFQKILLVGKHDPEQNWVAIKIRKFLVYATQFCHVNRVR